GTAINLFVNSPITLPLGQKGNIYDFGGTTSFVLGVGDSIVGPVYAYDRFSLFSGTNGNLLFPNIAYPYTTGPLPAIGLANDLRIQVDPSFVPEGSSNTAAADYDLTRFGVVPLDVRIEALMYAQEGSFFIIPGPWFNPNPNDTVENFLIKG